MHINENKPLVSLGWLSFYGKIGIHRQTSIFLAAVWVLTSTSATACPEKLPKASITVNGRQLLVEVATKPSQRRCGLSHRLGLPEDRGMLFIFPKPEFLSFWMKDTVLFLSIAFFDDTGRIISIQKMIPMSTEPRYRSPVAVRYALEVNQGWFERNTIHIGDLVDLKMCESLNPIH